MLFRSVYRNYCFPWEELSSHNHASWGLLNKVCGYLIGSTRYRIQDWLNVIFADRTISNLSRIFVDILMMQLPLLH